MSGKLISLRHHQALHAWRDGHRCLALADEAGAMAAFQAASRYDPELWQADVDLGRLFQQQGAMEPALAILARAVGRTEAPEAHLAYGRACDEAGNYPRAIKQYQKASRLLGDSEPALYFDWAMAALAMDDFDQASLCLDRYRRLKPEDHRCDVLARQLPRLREFAGLCRRTPKAQAYIQDGAMLLGAAGDDGLDIPFRVAAALDYRDLAVVAHRFLHLAAHLAWDWDGFTVGTRSVRPWAQALSVLTGRPIVERKLSLSGQRLIHLELNWGEAAMSRLAILHGQAGAAWGMSLGLKAGVGAAAITGMLALVSVPWFHSGALPTALGSDDRHPYLEADQSASVPAILAAWQALSPPGDSALIQYYAREHCQFAARSLAKPE